MASSSSLSTGAFLLFIGIRWFPSIGSLWLFLGASLLLKDVSESNPPKPYDVLKSLTYVAVFSAASFWQRQVTGIVLEPYLDEVFHIPQAQAYCNGDYYVWDPKLTTPPGLYAFSTFFIQSLGRLQCSVWNLRAFNTFALIATVVYACDCRRLVTNVLQRHSTPLESPAPPKTPASLKAIAPSKTSGSLKSRASPKNQGSLKTMGSNKAPPLAALGPIVSNQTSILDLHTAVNVALFPPLFFFSGLYYTDVLSTCLVILAFKIFLQRGVSFMPSLGDSLLIYVIGLFALTMRQTNIFWVAVFLGGLEAVRTIKLVAAEQTSYIQNQFHDVPLADAGVGDFILCAASLAITVLKHPFAILARLWPYIALLLSFGAFVIWNGGVVLGDKSNHVATIHLPQLLYLWPFIAFFSWPLLFPSAIKLLFNSVSTILFLLKPSPVPKLPTIRKIAIPILSASIALLASLVVIHFNTLIHPFTLADNRHYIFYVFRYTILRHPLIRYLLAPIYILCFYLCYAALCSPPSTPSSNPSSSSKPSSIESPPKRTPQQKRIIANTTASTSAPAAEANKTAEVPTTAFFLVWLLSTALSLITAPLVEPRYFIIPWVMWRLHVPSMSLPPAQSMTAAAKDGPAVSGSGAAKKNDEKKEAEDSALLAGSLLSGLDSRLLAETAWFVLVNGVTGYVFLYKGFEWVSEPGLVQRFMW